LGHVFARKSIALLREEARNDPRAGGAALKRTLSG
jgi:hypothetical protein